jgi:hypothetical protein
MNRRSGSTGRSNPAVVASSRDQTPVVRTTRSVGDPSARALDAGDAAVLDDDSLHGARLLHTRPELGRPAHATLHDEVGRDRPGDRIEDGAAEILDRELRHDLPRLFGLQHARLDSGCSLVHEVGLEAPDVSWVIQKEEVAVEAEVELLAHLLLEALQPPDGLDPDPDVQLVREQRADTAGAVAGRA